MARASDKTERRLDENLEKKDRENDGKTMPVKTYNTENNPVMNRYINPYPSSRTAYELSNTKGKEGEEPTAYLADHTRMNERLGD